MTTATVGTTSRISRWKDQRILATFVPEIRRRGGETAIWGENRRHDLAVADRARIDGVEYVLLRAEGFRYYSRAVGSWWANIAYLVGVDDSGPWAARVPGTIASVAGALRALTPPEAQERAHLRQGDVYLVRLNRRGCTTPSGTVNGTHLWDAETRTLTHQPEDGRAHAPVIAPASWPSVKVVPQRTYESRRGRTRD